MQLNVRPCSSPKIAIPFSTPHALTSARRVVPCAANRAAAKPAPDAACEDPHAADAAPPASDFPGPLTAPRPPKVDWRDVILFQGALRLLWPPTSGH